MASLRQSGAWSGARRDGGRMAPWLVYVLPVLAFVAGVIFDIETPSRFTASPLFAAAPLLMAPFSAARYTAVMAVASLAAVVVLDFSEGILSRGQSITEALTVFTVSGLALLINHGITRGSRRLESARVMAETAQRAVMPAPPNRIAHLRIAARYEAAQEDAYVGGDLFAVQDSPHGVRLLIGDVRGKGPRAVSVVALAIGCFREAAEAEASLESLAQRMDRTLMRQGARNEEDAYEEPFVTAVFAEVPRGGAGVRLLNRGHPGPLLLLPDGSLLTAEPTEHALPLGMMEMAAENDRVDEVRFPVGATLLLYTDGLSEARNRRGVFYDPHGRIRGRAGQAPDTLLDALVADVRAHTGGRSRDDLALLAVQRRADERQGPAAAERGRERFMDRVRPPRNS